MFKKIEIWILYLFIFLGIPISISFGVLVRQGTEGVTKRGNVDISFLTKPAVYIARIPEKLIMKLGAEGFIAYDRDKDRNILSQSFPALTANPLDVTGAGDSLLALMAIGLASKQNMFEK